jgi:hypothetical protein
VDPERSAFLRAGIGSFRIWSVPGSLHFFRLFKMSWESASLPFLFCRVILSCKHSLRKFIHALHLLY